MLRENKFYEQNKRKKARVGSGAWRTAELGEHKLKIGRLGQVLLRLRTLLTSKVSIHLFIHLFIL